jgi:tetratricopeptide (TPR) repeat protein
VALSEGVSAALRGDARILLARAVQGRDSEGAETMLSDVLADLGDGTTPAEERVRGLAHMQLGVVLRMRDPARARTHLEAARPLLEGAEEWEWLASVWLSLGLIAQAEGQDREAIRSYIRAIRTALAHNLLDRFGWSCNNLAWVFIDVRPRPHLALRLIDAALSVARQARNWELVAILTVQRGLCNCYVGDLLDAEVDYIAARRQFEALDRQVEIGTVWCNLGEVYSMQGATQRAESALGLAFPRVGAGSVPSGLESELRFQTGIVRLQQCRFEDAESQFERAASLVPAGERARALAHQAWASFRIRGLDPKTEQLLDAADADAKCGSTKSRGDVARIRARCIAETGDLQHRELSEALYRQSIELYRQSRTATWSLADARLGFGLLLAGEPSRRAEARDCLQAALEAFVRMEELGADRKCTCARKALEILDKDSR